MTQNEAEMTPQQHAHHIAELIQQAYQECRNDAARVSDPHAQTLFQTVATVLEDTMKSLNDYASGHERVWREATNTTQTRSSSPRASQTPTVTDLTVDIDENEPPPHLHTEVPHQ